MKSLKIIYSSTASIPNRNKLFDGDLFSFSSRFYFFFVPLLPHGVPLEHLAPATQPRGRGGCPFLRGEHQTFWCSPQWRLPVLGTIDPRANFARGKTALPRAGARNHARVEQVVLFQVDRKHRQEFRQSSFHFSGRTYTSSPLEYKRFPPTGEKPQDPWGPSWLRLGPSRGESWPC